ncbi:MAG: hypothetical protein F9K13_13215 [Candidatus Methylomirabilis oxygeniifera]|nr:MAG: hypothetical protein F9K13_13215 [Candidatus Methylomirabilis oxyfera]
MSRQKQTLLDVVERLAAVLVAWPETEIRRFFQACDIRVFNRSPLPTAKRRFIEESLHSLDWLNPVGEIRLQLLCNLVLKETRARVSFRNGESSKVDDLETAMRQKWGCGGWAKSRGSNAEGSRLRRRLPRCLGPSTSRRGKA